VFLAQPSGKFHSSRKCNTKILSSGLLSFSRFFFLSDHYVYLILEYYWLLFRDALILVFGQETESAVRPLSCCAFLSPSSAVSCLTLMQREHRQRSFMPRNANYSSEIKNW
jgi:hypothetical protein